MQVILSEDAKKQYKRLPLNEQNKIRKKLLSLEQNPFNGKKLTGEFSNYYSIKVWPYRIIYEINISLKRVEVHKIAHRQGVYK
ncbi:hypothetical protein A3C26_02605 [Candidatus Daviesbacteria bacterium RIFCSPHIGHO2_02_FULL_39_12]|uniref:Addiction module toxin RelE n=2 Tax=Candidatus Daviesiibacteriota TaxID=1752718 RepID=A0A1F5JDL3_9BACT|nr:MAG: hypothetical protein A3C26_02605 [Candidatus Daviesbacteria bacterium RIFCSPHIGHO2_02_FULL_39_12]OGE71536.1 MAG: hypothetical protein A3H40_00735 [Candidatus Daviesbacteria bacterium RIFCSPLOWO2_02_FULL_38_15]